uniref:Uncharacterized protein n=1 Tax=Romanomermis culicivorax TaxID=13658 RepID=A0A915INC7_ROMCU
MPVDSNISEKHVNLSSQLQSLIREEPGTQEFCRNKPNHNMDESKSKSFPVKEKNFVELCSEGTKLNKSNVKCRFCSCVILAPASATLSDDFQTPLPEMTAKGSNLASHSTTTTNTDFPLSTPLKYFWSVDDIFKFENCGFSNTVDGRKFLICADCEMGPIGFQDLDSKMCHIALDRVSYT